MAHQSQHPSPDMNQECGIHHQSDCYELKTELMHHLPYAISSVAFGLIILSFLNVIAFMPGSGSDPICRAGGMLFHSFHFLHIVFAATGTLITYFRFSKQVVRGIIIGVLSSTFFCILSDIIMPYAVGRLLGVHMHFHVCFMYELHNIIPFLVAGVINGYVMSKRPASKQAFYSMSSHFAHIFVSSMASLFYMISHGFSDWAPQMGMVFISLIVAVVVPCTLSDVVVPIYFARKDKTS